MKYFNFSISIKEEGSEILRDNSASFEDCKPIFEELIKLAVAINQKISIWGDITEITIHPTSNLEDIMEIYFLNKTITKLRDEKTTVTL